MAVRAGLAEVLAAVSAAVWFGFFLTVPYERFTITRAADIETTVLCCRCRGAGSRTVPPG